MARKTPPPFTHPPRDFAEAYKLSLPSFGIDIYRSDPKTQAIPKGVSAPDMAPVNFDSGEAFSATYKSEGKGVLPPVDQSFLPLSRGYLRRILLEILVREEYGEVYPPYSESRAESKDSEKETPRQNVLDQEVFERSGPKARVRLSDLRLAPSIEPKVLRRELEETLGPLINSEDPMTTDDVLRWKWKTLKEYKSASIKESRKEPSRWTEKERKAEDTRVIAVSFAAAALCLFLDMGSPSLREYPLWKLLGAIRELAEVIQKLTETLGASVETLGTLLAAREAGRPKAQLDPYTALHLYRMDLPHEELAEKVSISPGSKNWKNRLMKKVRRGVEVEKGRYPRAAHIFTDKAEDEVQQKAIRAYRKYLREEAWRSLEPWIAEAKVGYDLLPDVVPDTPRTELRRAYIQLGCCLEHGIDPLPSD